jgi:hypothetical protein
MIAGRAVIIKVVFVITILIISHPMIEASPDYLCHYSEVVSDLLFDHDSEFMRSVDHSPTLAT